MATGGIALNGSTQYLELSSKVVSGFPFTLVCWVAQNTSGSSQFVIAQQQSNGDRYAGAWLDSNGTTKYANLRNPGNSDSASKLSSPHPSASLQLMVAVFTSTTSRTVYFGDNTGATSTTSMTDDITNHDRITIGAWHYNSGAAGLLLNGAVAEAHIFNTALSSSDVTTLLTTAPEGVTGWVDGWTLANNSSLTSIGGTRTLTAVGSPTTASLTLPYTRVAAPVLTSATGAATGNTTANAGATIDTVSGSGTRIMYALPRIGGSAASAATIKSTGTQLAITSSGAKSVALTGLTNGSSYSADIVYSDATLGDSNVITATWTQTAAPVLSSPTNTPGSTTALIGATTTVTSGTAYYLARVGGSAASAATIIATGQTSTVSTTTPSRTVTGLTASTANNYVDVVQVSGVTTSNVVSAGAFTTTASGDTTAPTLTGSIVIGTVTSSSIQFSWSAGSDNVAVTSYEVSKDGGSNYVDAGNVLTYTFTGLTASTSYPLRVRAKDAAGNVSSPALAATQSTAAASGVGSIDLSNSALYTFRKNNGAAITSTAVTFFVNDASTGVLVGSAITGLSTNALGVVTTPVSNASMNAGSTYRLTYEFSSGEYGCAKLPAV